jgi:hypothetical protein
MFKSLAKDQGTNPKQKKWWTNMKMLHKTYNRKGHKPPKTLSSYENTK